MNLAPEILHHDACQRHWRQCHQGQVGADPQHEEERKDREEDGVRAVHQRWAQQHAHGIQIVCHAGHDVAGAVALVKPRVLKFQLFEEVVAQVEFDLARDADQNPALRIKKDAFDEGDRDQDEREDQNQLMRCALLDPVDRHAQNSGNWTAMMFVATHASVPRTYPQR